MTKSVKCPRCGAFTAHVPFVSKNASGYQFEFNYGFLRMVKCLACEKMFFTEHGLAVWPLPRPSSPEHVPEKVREAYEDARLAHAAGANIAALMAARTVLVRFLRDKGAESFKELVEKQIITPAVYGGVDQLRMWANITGHEDLETGAFEPSEVKDILDYLGTALEAAYTHQARVDRFVKKTGELKQNSER